MGYDVRLSTVKKCTDDLQQLMLINRASTKFEVDLDMLADRGGFVQRFDVVGRSIDNGDELLDVFEISQRLDTASGGTGANGHKALRRPAYAMDAFCVVLSGDGAFDKRKIVWTFDLCA
jgi:hypothetical protein